jgi:hypothetical protein
MPRHGSAWRHLATYDLDARHANATAELKGLMRGPSASMGSHGMHDDGSMGRQLHPMDCVSCMPCVLCMHHSRPPLTSTSSTSASMGQHKPAAHAQRMPRQHMQGAHPGACANSFGGAEAALQLSFQHSRRLRGGSHMTRWLGVHSLARAILLTGARGAAAGMRRLQRLGRRLEGGLMPRPLYGRTASTVGCAMRRVLNPPQHRVALPTAWAAATAVGTALTAVTSSLPAPPPGRRACCHGAHFLLGRLAVAVSSRRVAGRAGVRWRYRDAPPSLGLLSVLLQLWKMHV